jgi:hypothetical protein
MPKLKAYTVRLFSPVPCFLLEDQTNQLQQNLPVYLALQSLF